MTDCTVQPMNKRVMEMLLALKCSTFNYSLYLSDTNHLK